MEPKHPVFTDTTDREIVYGANQSQYTPVHGITSDGPDFRITYRFSLTLEERAALLDGTADLMVTLLTFGGTPQPVMLWCASEGAMRRSPVAREITGIPEQEPARASPQVTLGKRTKLSLVNAANEAEELRALKQLETLDVTSNSDAESKAVEHEAEQLTDAAMKERYDALVELERDLTKPSAEQEKYLKVFERFTRPEEEK